MSDSALEQENTEELQINTGVGISEDKQEEMASYLRTEVDAVFNNEDRQEYMTIRERIKKDRIAQPDSASKSTPWEGASNVKPPVTLQKVNTVYSKLINNIFADEKLVSISAIDKTLCDKAEIFEDWFNNYLTSPNGMDIKNKAKAPLYDLVSLGTAAVRIPWIREEVTIKKKDGSEVIQVRRNGPQLDYVPLQHFVTRAQWSDVQRSPWVGVIHSMTLADLRREVRNGFFDPANVDLILGAPSDLDEQTRADAALLGLEPKSELTGNADGNFEVVETWLQWDAEAEGVMNEVKVFFERSTGTVLRAEFNPLGDREIVVGRYTVIPGNLYGLGLGDICLAIQAEVTAAHNFRINAMNLVLSPPMKYRIGSNVTKDTRLFPGQMLGVEDMGDLEWMLLPPGIADIAMQTEQMGLSYADQASGASQVLTGQSDQTLKSGGGAQANWFLAQQSSSVLNAVQINAAQFFSEIFTLALKQFVLNSDVADFSQLTPEDAAAVQEILKIPLEDIPTKLKFSVKLAEMDKSDEAMMQKALNAFQLYGQYNQAVLPLVQLFSPPAQGQPPIPEPIKQMALQAYAGNTKLLQKLFKDVGIEYPEQYFPDVSMELKMLQQFDEMKKQQVNDALEGGQGGGAVAQPGVPADTGFGGSPGGAPGASAPAGGGVPPGAQVPEGNGY